VHLGVLMAETIVAMMITWKGDKEVGIIDSELTVMAPPVAFCRQVSRKLISAGGIAASAPDFAASAIVSRGVVGCL
jgi:hypothetical protein